MPTFQEFEALLGDLFDLEEYFEEVDFISVMNAHKNIIYKYDYNDGFPEIRFIDTDMKLSLISDEGESFYWYLSY